YYAVPNEPGEYKLGEYFNWVFFNTSTLRYDTLSSDITIPVTGKSRQNDYISAQDVGTFYDEASLADNRLRSLANEGWLQLLANALILGMLVLTVVVVFKK